jgi:hypothetical protein
LSGVPPVRKLIAPVHSVRDSDGMRVISMSSTATRTPATIGHGDHVCAVFASEDERQRVLTSFVRVGLAAWDRVCCLTDAPTPTVVLDLLRTGGVSVDEAVSSGQLVVRTAEETYLANPPFDPATMIDTFRGAVEDALADGYGGFRVTGEMSWSTRDAADVEHLWDYERHLGEALATLPAAAVCQYDARWFAPATLDAARLLHPQRLARTTDCGELLVVSPLVGRVGVRLTGEADVSNRDQLRTALAHVLAGDGDEVHLELAGLRFISVGCAAELLALTSAHPVRRLVLHDPPPTLRRALDLCWPDLALEVRCS